MSGSSRVTEAGWLVGWMMESECLMSSVYVSISFVHVCFYMKQGKHCSYSGVVKIKISPPPITTACVPYLPVPERSMINHPLPPPSPPRYHHRFLSRKIITDSSCSALSYRTDPNSPPSRGSLRLPTRVPEKINNDKLPSLPAAYLEAAIEGL